MLTMDGREIVERVAVGDLRDGAGKHYETDGFDMDTFMDASHDIQADGFEPGAAITDADTFEEFGQEQRPADVDAEAVRVYEWIVAATDTDGLLDGEILFIGEGAVVRPQVAPSELLVRYPKGVAQYEFDALTCPYCGDERSSRNDVLQCIVVNHDADMSRWSEV